MARRKERAYGTAANNCRGSSGLNPPPTLGQLTAIASQRWLPLKALEPNSLALLSSTVKVPATTGAFSACVAPI